jgi:type I restriction enzyme M protein
MAIKKSELYSSLWFGCDEPRGGMDASQYKDYVLVLLFIKYVSDKYAGVPYAPLANANKLSDMPDFNDPSKLGSGAEMVERLTNLISIFENKAVGAD